jgi:hypothetical protein
VRSDLKEWFILRDLKSVSEYPLDHLTSTGCTSRVVHGVVVLLMTVLRLVTSPKAFPVELVLQVFDPVVLHIGSQLSEVSTSLVFLGASLLLLPSAQLIMLVLNF